MTAVCIAFASTRVKPDLLHIDKIDTVVASQLANSPWLWTKLILATKFSPGVKVSALAMAQFVNRGDACCWPSHKTIGASCDQTESTVRHAMAALHKNGLISVRRRFNRSNVLYLALPQGLAMVADGTGRFKITGTASMVQSQKTETREKVATGKRTSAGPAVPSYRPDGAKVIGTVQTPNFLESNHQQEPRKKENNQNSFLSNSQSSNIIIFPNRLAIPIPIESCPKQEPIHKPEPNDLLPRASNDEKAIRAIQRAAMNYLGIGPMGRAACGGFRDQQVISAIPAKTMAGLVQKCRQGRLGRAEIGQTLAEAGIVPKLDLNRCVAG